MKIRAITAAVVLLAGLAGCGGQPASHNVTLRMTTWSNNEAHVKLFTEIAASYKQTHPDVTVRFDALPFESYTTTVTTQIAGGNPPDLAWVLENAAPDFVSSGALAPLDGAIENESDLTEAATKLWRQDGKLIAYPFSTSPFGVFVNTDLIKQLPEPWTWESAMAAAARSKGLVVRDFDYKNWDNLATIFQGWGAEAWSADGKTCGFNQPAMVDAMTFIHKSIFTDEAMPGPGTSADFFAGEAAMTVTQISRASLLKDAKFRWTLVPLPAGPKGEYSVIGQGGVGVLKKGKQADAAKDFLTFFTNAGNSAKLAQFFPPPRKSQLTAASLAKANPLLEPEQLQDVVINGIETGVVKPSHTSNAELSQTVRSALDPLWKPDADVPAVLNGVCTAIQPLL
ncbi:sugar ABC transporter substrate-binding protein [Actinoplanes sp. NBRC 103695]|uniref:ABC transporter substrate-binding protein n=1 Tax=Actinoplanes sp. NBRC 103695 TaxID=3032202 RepID=UPI0024A04C8B|nr:sugar ABC transporter substrate-binding protein [Actinoplanes sp. NBRC 103695]GLY94872.1 sugar ABC transporter substrate-binding protein [Actinoplanes sp. NBRC 103695]